MVFGLPQARTAASPLLTVAKHEEKGCPSVEQAADSAPAAVLPSTGEKHVSTCHEVNAGNYQVPDVCAALPVTNVRTWQWTIIPSNFQQA